LTQNLYNVRFCTNNTFAITITKPLNLTCWYSKIGLVDMLRLQLLVLLIKLLLLYTHTHLYLLFLPYIHI